MEADNIHSWRRLRSRLLPSLYSPAPHSRYRYCSCRLHRSLLLSLRCCQRSRFVCCRLCSVLFFCCCCRHRCRCRCRCCYCYHCNCGCHPLPHRKLSSRFALHRCMAAANSKIDLRSELFLMFMFIPLTKLWYLVSPTIFIVANFPSWKIVYGIRCSIAVNEKAGWVGFPRLEMEADIVHLWHRLHPRMLSRAVSSFLNLPSPPAAVTFAAAANAAASSAAPMLFQLLPLYSRHCCCRHRCYYYCSSRLPSACKSR